MVVSEGLTKGLAIDGPAFLNHASFDVLPLEIKRLALKQSSNFTKAVPALANLPRKAPSHLLDILLSEKAKWPRSDGINIFNPSLYGLVERAEVNISALQAGEDALTTDLSALSTQVEGTSWHGERGESEAWRAGAEDCSWSPPGFDRRVKAQRACCVSMR